jgi:23S rRNA (uracil1939-C5)-methyltransferase
LNAIDNVFFYNDQMRKYLHGLSETGTMEPNSVTVVDPPRAGLSPKPIQRLLACAPRRILYVSCKSTVLRDELPAFLKAYTLDRLWAVDMFPHTPHVEVLASMTRK